MILKTLPWEHFGFMMKTEQWLHTIIQTNLLGTGFIPLVLKTQTAIRTMVIT